MMENKCSICRKKIEAEEPAVLTVGGFGNAKYLCPDCGGELETVTADSDVQRINAAMESIGKKLKESQTEDSLVLSTLKEIFDEASDRAEKIKSGEYDFSAEEQSAVPEDSEIPEELLESEEDKELDRKEAIRNKKIDKVTNWICLALLLAALGFFVYRVIDTYFL